MAIQNVFKRYEYKYLLTIDQYNSLREVMKEHMLLDEYARHRINNIYFDTPDFLLIRRSIEKPVYKEKLRLRSYAADNNKVFIEIKKKYDGIVYKRRVSLNQEEAYNYLLAGEALESDNQIVHELDYFMHFYENLVPAAFLTYEREAFYGIEDGNFRMTFDYEIAVRDYEITNLDLTSGQKLLPENLILLEVKTANGNPLWLQEFFKENEIVKTSFSKYGTAYKKYLKDHTLGGAIEIA